MPYVITTIRDERGVTYASDPVAVATLEEARENIAPMLEEAFPYGPCGNAKAIRELSESGGTVGPLPDGRIIEVSRVGWIDFEMMARRGDTGLPPIEIFDRDDYRADLIAAFNAS